MFLLVFMAKIPAQTLPTICWPLCTGVGFIPLEMTKSSREGKISGPSWRRQSRCPGLLLSCFQKTTLLQDGVSRSWQRSWNANGTCNKLCCPFSTRLILPIFEIRMGLWRKCLPSMRNVIRNTRWRAGGLLWLRLQTCPGGTRKILDIGNSFSSSIYYRSICRTGLS